MSPRMYFKPGKVVQADFKGVVLSWNPDDERFYIEHQGKTIASYKDWRNATAKWREVTKTV